MLCFWCPYKVSLMKGERVKTCQMSYVLECSGRWSKQTEKLGGVCGRNVLLPSPSLAIYSPYHHTYSMCISTVHYCCHRNVMHSVSYRLTELNGRPCLICSGSFILILYWKGIVNTVWRRDEKREGRRGWKKKRKRRLDPPFCSYLHLSSHPSFISLPLFSNVCSVHWQSVWISSYHIHTYSCIILQARCYIFCHSVTRSVFVSLIGSGGGRCFQRHWNCWYSLCGDKEEFYLRWYRHWKMFGVMRFY